MKLGLRLCVLGLTLGLVGCQSIQEAEVPETPEPVRPKVVVPKNNDGGAIKAADEVTDRASGYVFAPSSDAEKIGRITALAREVKSARAKLEEERRLYKTYRARDLARLRNATRALARYVDNLDK